MAPVFSELVNKSGFYLWGIERNSICKSVPGNFLDFLGVLVSPKINNIGFGARGRVQKSRNHRNDEFGVLS